MPEVQINFLAVLVAAAAAFLLGGLWYSPAMFAKQWVSAHGYTEEQVKELQKTAGRAYAVSALLFIVMGLVMGMLVHYTGFSTVLQGLQLGALLWVGFVGAVGLISNMYSNKHISTFYIDAAYQLVYLLIMSAIITVWR